MYNGWFSYGCDSFGFCGWQSESCVLASTRPGIIRCWPIFVGVGTIADSRRVGDVMYLATEQSGGCWGCEPESNTTLTSFDLSQPGSFTQPDQLRLPSVGIWAALAADQRHRSAHLRRRLRLRRELQRAAGLGAGGDISDPSGRCRGHRLRRGGADPEPLADGRVRGRVPRDQPSRVAGAPGRRRCSRRSRCRRRTTSSGWVILTVSLAQENECCRAPARRSARHHRGAARPAVHLRPLDPAELAQLGELEMPGVVYHLAPRGDRVFARLRPGDPRRGAECEPVRRGRSGPAGAAWPGGVRRRLWQLRRGAEPDLQGVLHPARGRAHPGAVQRRLR